MKINNKVILVGLSSSQKLAQNIAKNLDIKLCDIDVFRFADGEILVRSKQSIRHKHVVIVQSTSKPVNENIMELLIAIDSFKRADAKTITVIIPYYGYSRQDRKTLGREPITSKLVAKLIEQTGATHIALLDVHSEQQQGFFEIPVDTLPSIYLIMEQIKKDNSLKNTTIIAPDYGSVKRARKIAARYNLPLVIMDKRRPEPNKAEISNVLGDVRGKNCIICDDIIDTGGTIVACCQVLKEKGANDIIVAGTHGIFSGNATEKLNDAIAKKIIKHIYITNSIEGVYETKINNLKIIDLSMFLAKVIKIYNNNEESANNSISKLYEKM